MLLEALVDSPGREQINRGCEKTEHALGDGVIEAKSVLSNIVKECASRERKTRNPELGKGDRIKENASDEPHRDCEQRASSNRAVKNNDGRE